MNHEEGPHLEWLNRADTLSPEEIALFTAKTQDSIDSIAIEQVATGDIDGSIDFAQAANDAMDFVLGENSLLLADIERLRRQEDVSERLLRKIILSQDLSLIHI